MAPRAVPPSLADLAKSFITKILSQ